VADCLAVGAAVGLEGEARAAADALARRIERARRAAAERPPGAHTNVAFLEWTDPLFMGCARARTRRRVGLKMQAAAAAVTAATALLSARSPPPAKPSSKPCAGATGRRS
jgi:hypothetical protein